MLVGHLEQRSLPVLRTFFAVEALIVFVDSVAPRLVVGLTIVIASTLSVSEILENRAG